MAKAVQEGFATDGTLTFGTQDSPYWKVLNVIDVWNSSKVLNGSTYLGGAVTGETGVNGALSTLPNNIDYQTPIFNGFTRAPSPRTSGSWRSPA